MAVIPTTWSQADRGGYNTVTNGDLTTSYTAYLGSNVRSVHGLSAGSAYFELRIDARHTSAYINLGFWPASQPINTYIYNTSGVVRIAPGSHAVNDVFGVAFDAAARLVTVTRNGVTVGTSSVPLITEPWHAVVGDDNTTGICTMTANFGQSSFQYSPPGGATPGLGPTAYTLSGVTTGSTGTPVQRPVRAIREDTGAYVGGTISNATTGAYMITTNHAGEHTVVAYPVTGENLPALVHRGVIPI